VIFFSPKASLTIFEEGIVCQLLALVAGIEKVKSTIDKLLTRIENQVDAFFGMVRLSQGDGLGTGMRTSTAED